MSEYTPTTEEIRERFIDGIPIDTWAVARDNEGKKFDRWLQAERARIWGDGFDAGYKEAGAGPLEDFSVNPYRKKA